MEFQSEAGEIQQVATQFETLRPNQNFRPRFNKRRVRNKDRRVGKKVPKLINVGPTLISDPRVFALIYIT